MKSLHLTELLAIATLAVPSDQAFAQSATSQPPCCQTNGLAAGPFTDASIYQVESVWTNDVNQPLRLGALRGRVQVVVMFFASCEYACSVLVNDLKRIEAALPKDTRARTGFLLISFDTVRDAPEVLRAFRQRMELPEERWTLVTGRPDDVRELAALLGVRYQQDTRGQFAHSNLLTVLNDDGEVIHQHTGLNRPVDKVVRAIVGCPQ